MNRKVDGLGGSLANKGFGAVDVELSPFLWAVNSVSSWTVWPVASTTGSLVERPGICSGAVPARGLVFLHGVFQLNGGVHATHPRRRGRRFIGLVGRFRAVPASNAKDRHMAPFLLQCPDYDYDAHADGWCCSSYAFLRSGQFGRIINENPTRPISDIAISVMRTRWRLRPRGRNTDGPRNDRRHFCRGSGR